MIYKIILHLYFFPFLLLHQQHRRVFIIQPKQILNPFGFGGKGLAAWCWGRRGLQGMRLWFGAELPPFHLVTLR